MIEFIVTAIIAVVVLIWYSLYLQPQKKMKKYKALFEANGYKVYVHPFKFLGFPLFDTLIEDGKKGDCLRLLK